MNLISNQHQNGRNKVVIEPRVVQFWSRMNLSQRFKNKFHARQVEISKKAINSQRLPLHFFRRSAFPSLF